ncbi:MAG: hypothetical protein ACJASQ_002983 [Crocinitomicaceae bacterium]|jgi:hypothetical protein
MATGKYTFIPWLKEGLGLSNEVVDKLTGPNDTTFELKRGKVTATLNYTADGVGTDLAGKSFSLFGPADVVGVKDESIINKYPAPNALTAEPNYLPYIEFYDEDFPWRYTPAVADSATSQRLTPWLTLIALKADEFDDESNHLLPAIKVKTVDDGGNTIPLALPQDPEETLWAWSHVQISDIIDSSTDQLLEDSVKAVRTDNPDAIISRIMCPRKSEPNTTYHLFLVPTFENGRLAGLGQTPFVEVMTMAWENTDTDVVLPYYQRWSYTTAENEDFESLIDQLEPITMDPDAGVRYFDIRSVETAFDNSLDYDILNPGASSTSTDRMGLMGALKSPSTSPIGWLDTAEKQEFEEEFQDYLNKASERINTIDNAEVHPVVMPPIYGQWHAKTENVPETYEGNPYNGWIRDVNIDLSNRATAGLGTDVVVDNQENFMDHAWEQVGDVIRANEAMNRATLSKEVAKCYYNRHLKSFDSDKLIKITKGVAKKLIPDGGTQTVYKEVSDSNLPNGNIERTYNRITRSGNRVTKTALDQAGLAVDTAGAKGFYKNLTADVNDITKQNITTAVNKDSLSTSFLSAANQNTIYADLLAAETGALDKTYYVVQTAQPSAQIFQDLNGLGYESEAAKPELDITTAKDNIVEAADPVSTISDKFEDLVSQVGQAVSPGKQLDQIQAAPHFRWPMYEHLLKVSTDLMFPGLDQIPDNCVTLLETNNEFIQTFMLGLNHEMSRELLWREYPTDQRGTYFKQFWDSIDFVNDLGETIDDEGVEAIRQDISDIHGWDFENNMGSASFSGDGTNTTATVENKMVLVVRGEALRRYPNTIIYAQKAEAYGGNVTRPLADDSISGNVQFPIFQAKVNDIVLLGFDLTADDVTGVNGGDGWYFVFRERPGQTRFGMDVERDLPTPVTIPDWNDLSWTDALNSSGFLSGAQIMNPRVGIDNTTTSVEWPNESATGSNTFEDTSSAEIGHALFQSPAMVAVHASKMLDNI